MSLGIGDQVILLGEVIDVDFYAPADPDEESEEKESYYEGYTYTVKVDDLNEPLVLCPERGSQLILNLEELKNVRKIQIRSKKEQLKRQFLSLEKEEKELNEES